MLIVLDPGHGGKDRSNQGPTGYVEADGVLSMALVAREILWDAGVKVKMTRETDKTVELYSRSFLANEWEAVLLISIHTNGATNPLIGGAETWYSLNGDWGGLYHREAKELALAVQAQVVETTGFKDRGIKTKLITREDSPIKGLDYYAMLRKTKCPSIIVEAGFHTNPEEEAKLKDEKFPEKVGQAIARGILLYLDVPYPLYPLVKQKPYERKPTDELQPAPVTLKGQDGEGVWYQGSIYIPVRKLQQVYGKPVNYDPVTQSVDVPE